MPWTRRARGLSAPATLAGLLALASPAVAQDSQYWDIQYGRVGQLLHGQVVGSTRDLSATYYNPGGLSLSADPDFLLSVQAFEKQTLTTKPVEGGKPLDSSDTEWGTFPGFFAFAFPESWLGKKTRLAFSLLCRQQANQRIDQRFAGNEPASEGRYGLETLFDQRMQETWVGLTLSRRVGVHWGLGATLYGVHRSQRTRWEQNLQLTLPGGEGIAALVVNDFDYGSWRVLDEINTVISSGWNDMPGKVLALHMDESPASNGSLLANSFENAYGGTVVTDNGTANKSTTGYIGNALSLDKVNDYVNLKPHREHAFILKNGVTIYGGYPAAGGDVRDWVNNVTTLSGDIGVAANNADNSYHVIAINAGINATAVLDGFTITGGNANGSYNLSRGGGMHNSESSPTLSNLLRERDAQPAGQRPAIVGCAVDSKSFVRPPAGTDLVVVDTPGGLTGLELARVVMYADAILMPVCNSLFDRESASDCLAELRILPRVASGRCRLATIGMRVEAGSEGHSVLQRWAADRQLPFIATLRESATYVRCAEQGLTLFDLPPAVVRPDMVEWQPILDWLAPVLRPAAPVAISANDARIAPVNARLGPVLRRPDAGARPAVHPVPARTPPARPLPGTPICGCFECQSASIIPSQPFSM